MIFFKSVWSLDESLFPQSSRPCVDLPKQDASDFQVQNQKLPVPCHSVRTPRPANIFLSGWPAHSDLNYVEGHYAPFAVELFPSHLFCAYPRVVFSRQAVSPQAWVPADATLKEALALASLSPISPVVGLSDASSLHPFDHRDLLKQACPGRPASGRAHGIERTDYSINGLLVRASLALGEHLSMRTQRYVPPTLRLMKPHS